MFLRFTKGQFKKYINGHGQHEKTFTKTVFLGDSVVMEYGNHIVGIAKLHEESDKCLDYDVVVAAHAPIPADKIARNIKNMIGTSNKWEDTPSIKRRKYYVEEVDCDTLPVKAEIKFSRMY